MSPLASNVILKGGAFLTPRGVGNFVLLRGVPLGLEPLLRTAPVSSPGALVGTVFFFTSAFSFKGRSSH